MRIYDRNIRTEIWARPWSGGSILLSRYFCRDSCLVPSVAFCSVGRIGPSPSNRSIRTTLQQQGTPWVAHGVQIKRPSWVNFCFGGCVLSRAAPSFLRILRLFAAKPWPCPFQIRGRAFTAAEPVGASDCSSVDKPPLSASPRSTPTHVPILWARATRGSTSDR